MNMELYKLLLDKGKVIYLNHKTTYDSLLNDCYNQNDINLVDKYGWNLLHYAIYYDFGDVIEKLISSGINIDAQCNQGNTSLHLAVLFEKNECIKILLNNNANPLLKNFLNDIPRDCAHFNGDIEFLLLRAENNYVKQDDDIEVMFANTLKL